MDKTPQNMPQTLNSLLSLSITEGQQVLRLSSIHNEEVSKTSQALSQSSSSLFSTIN